MLGQFLVWVVLGACSLHASFAFEKAAPLTLVYLFCLLQLARAGTWRGAFYSGLATGLIISTLELGFFWRIFSGGALALWVVFSFWLGLFVAIARLCWQTRLPIRNWRLSGSVLIPFVWCGLEYFRSELYYLRFSWVSPGFAFAGASSPFPFGQIGVYGTGFVLAGLACFAAVVWNRAKLQGVILLAIACGLTATWTAIDTTRSQLAPASKSLNIAGVQMEFPSELEAVDRLNKLIRQHPAAELLVLSECTFKGPLPERIKRWCRQRQRYLLVGAEEPAGTNNYYNTALVVSPAGEIVFRQAKCVPIQFFRDGLPAPEQKLWDSPWGKLGICICYDLSYSRVTDRLVQMGAQGLVVPTMDMAPWGRAQHELHARVAPLRAAEYRVPVFRLASSGISQLVDAAGRTRATAPCLEDAAIISGMMDLPPCGRLPWDRVFAPASVAVTGLIIIGFAARWLFARRELLPKAQPQPEVLA